MTAEAKKVKQGWLRKILTAVTPQELLRMLAVYLAGVAVMFSLLVAVSLIPNAWIEKNVQTGMALAQEEYIGKCTPIFSYTPAEEIDLWSDNIIMQMMLQDPEKPLLQQAMDRGWEDRYWQGFHVFLRPLFILFTYADVRELMLYLLTGLVAISSLRMHKRFGAPAVAGFVIALVMGHTMIVTWCMEYFQIFWVALAAVACLLRHYEPEKICVGKLATVFLVIGMVTQYVDFFTAPLLTLCLPLAVVLAADMQQESMETVERWARFLWSCAGWAFGWLFGWAAKWPIGSVILHKNIVADALQTALYRSALRQSTEEPVSMLHALGRNIACFLPMSQLRIRRDMAVYILVQAVFVCIVVWMIAQAFRRHPSRRRWAAVLPSLCCAALPYLWFMVLAGHTDIHFEFTYRTQIGSVFLLWNAWLYLTGRLGREKDLQ